MPTATFAASGSSLLDQLQPNAHDSFIRVVGVYYLGASKTALYRTLLRFDVFGAAAEGRALTPADTIEAAELEWDVISVIGPAAWAATIKHVARADWDPLTATWNQYRTGAAWTTGGGDFDTPPVDVAYTSPAVIGAFVIAGIAEFVTDAIANEGGIVRLAQRANNEAPATTRTYEGSATVLPLLRVTYASREPSPVDHPDAGVMRGARAARAARPAAPAQAAKTRKPSAPA